MSFEWRIYVVQGSSVLYGIASRVMSSRESWNSEAELLLKFNQNSSFAHSDRVARFFTIFDSTSINSRDSTSNFCNIHPHSQIHGVSSAFRVLTIFIFLFQCQCPSPHVPHISKVAEQLRETHSAKLLIRELRDGIIFLIIDLISGSRD